MKKFLVIADIPPEKSTNFINHAIRSKQLPSDVKELADNSWLIDSHMSLSFFASIVHTAFEEKIPITVLHIEEETILLSHFR